MNSLGRMRRSSPFRAIFKGVRMKKVCYTSARDTRQLREEAVKLLAERPENAGAAEIVWDEVTKQLKVVYQKNP